MVMTTFLDMFSLKMEIDETMKLAVCCLTLQLYAEGDGNELLSDGFPVGEEGHEVVLVAHADHHKFDAEIESGGHLALVAGQCRFAVANVVF